MRHGMTKTITITVGWSVVIFIGSLLGAIVVANGDDPPEYKFVLDKLSKELMADEVIKTNLSFEEHDGEVVVNGEVEQFVDFDNDWKVQFDILRSPDGNEEYAMVMPLPKRGVCDMMQNRYKQYFYESLKEYANAPDPDVCPVVKEKYIINKYPLDTSKFRKHLKPGHYRIVSTLFDPDDKEILRYAVDGHVEEV